MKGDYSKLKSPAQIKGDHNYNVLIQQGRVNLDSDWNEQSQINTYRSEATYVDIIGESGAPLINAGFKIEPVIISPLASPLEGDLSISKGHYYVDGILCENDFENLTFESQPDLPYASLPTTEGNYLFYLDVWLRHITANEDGTLREVALGGPDTAARTKVVWQVKHSPTTSSNCDDALLPPETNLSTGALSARSEVVKDSGDPCGITSSGGYRGLQNQLYRVEIHTPGTDRTQATFKWSRDNGSVLVKCSGQDINDKNNLIVANTGRDDLLGFKSGNWIEIINDDNDLLNTPGILAQLLPSTGNILTIDPASIKDPNNAVASSVTINTTKNTRIRRWDSEAAIQLNTDDTWKPLEDGIEVNFSEGTFNTGDYWLLPVRTAIADVEWPYTEPQHPQGNIHHYAKLATASYDETNGWVIQSDCRNLFPSLTEQTGLYYVGGDGQQATPGSKLSEPLRVGVANGSLAVSGAKVKFVIKSGDAVIDTPADGIVTTDDTGIATCNLTLGSDTSTGLQVKANLVDNEGYPVDQKLPVIFSAGFNNPSIGRKSCNVTIGDGGDCETWEEVQPYIDKNNITDITLCLLQQPFNITGSLNINVTKSLRIIGFGSQTELTYDSSFTITATTIILEGLNIITGDGFKKGFINFSAVESIYISNCNFSGTRIMSAFDEITTPFVTISPLIDNKSPILFRLISSQISIKVFLENQWASDSYSVALALAPYVGGWIESNVINGTIVLTYVQQNLEWIILNDFGDRRINTDLLGNLKNEFGTLINADVKSKIIIRDNLLNNIVSDVISTIYYKSIIVSGNIFQKTILTFPSLSKGKAIEDVITLNLLSAQLVHIINNQFLDDEKEFGILVACSRDIIIGNIGIGRNETINASIQLITGSLSPDPALQLNNFVSISTQ